MTPTIEATGSTPAQSRSTGGNLLVPSKVPRPTPTQHPTAQQGPAFD